MLSHIDSIFITVTIVCRKIDFVIKDDLPSVWLNRPNLLCVPGVSNAVNCDYFSIATSNTIGLKLGLNFTNVYDV